MIDSIELGWSNKNKILVPHTKKINISSFWTDWGYIDVNRELKSEWGACNITSTYIYSFMCVIIGFLHYSFNKRFVYFEYEVGMSWNCNSQKVRTDLVFWRSNVRFLAVLSSHMIPYIQQQADVLTKSWLKSTSRHKSSS